MPVAGRNSDRTTENESEIREGFLDISVIAPKIQGPRGADRGFIAGRSGAGKTYLARRLLTAYGPEREKAYKGNIFIIDVNGLFDFPVTKTFHRVEEVKLNKNWRAVGYVPDTDQLGAVAWNELWKKLFLYEYPLMTYVDETRAMEPLFGRARLEEGNYLTAYLTRGRARYKAAILGAQRPVLIPRDIIGQAEWFYVFDLPLEDDRITMAGTIGEFSEDGERIRDRKALKRFEFWLKTPDLFDPTKATIVR